MCAPLMIGFFYSVVEPNLEAASSTKNSGGAEGGQSVKKVGKLLCST